MAIIDLTTLAAVKQYAQTTGTGQTDDDLLISSLITATSQLALNFLSRPSILSMRHTDIFTGTGGRFMGNIRPFRYQPVTAVFGVKVNGSTVPAIPATTAPNGSGFTFDPWDGIPPGAMQSLKLSGYGFNSNWNPNNCQIDYQAGFAATEDWIVPATPFRITPNSIYGMLLRDEGVIYTATGVPLIAIPSGTPAVGHYVPPSPLAASGPVAFYQFAAADAAAGVSITYSFVPAAMELAIRLWVSDMYKYRSRIGERSASEGGVQTTSYNIVALPDVTKLALQPFNTVNFLM